MLNNSAALTRGGREGGRRGGGGGGGRRGENVDTNRWTDGWVIGRMVKPKRNNRERVPSMHLMDADVQMVQQSAQHQAEHLLKDGNMMWSFCSELVLLVQEF